MDKIITSDEEPESQPGTSRRQVLTEREETEEYETVELSENWGMSSTLQDKLEIVSRYPRDIHIVVLTELLREEYSKFERLAN